MQAHLLDPAAQYRLLYRTLKISRMSHKANNQTSARPWAAFIGEKGGRKGIEMHCKLHQCPCSVHLFTRLYGQSTNSLPAILQPSASSLCFQFHFPYSSFLHLFFQAASLFFYIFPPSKTHRCSTVQIQRLSQDTSHWVSNFLVILWFWVTESRPQTRCIAYQVGAPRSFQSRLLEQAILHRIIGNVWHSCLRELSHTVAAGAASASWSFCAVVPDEHRTAFSQLSNLHNVKQGREPHKHKISSMHRNTP